MKLIRIGIIGCGRIAQEAHLPAIQNVDSLKLVAVCDADMRCASKIGQKLGVLNICKDIGEICSLNDVDALIICLPHHQHRDAVIEATSHGKHVLVEKPLGCTTAECDEMIACARENKVVLAVGHVMRYSQKIRDLKEEIVNGKIGKIANVRARRLTYHVDAAAEWWRSKKQCGGLVLPLIGSHLFDTIFWLTDASPKTVFAAGLTVRKQWEGEDEADITMILDNGAMASLALSFNSSMRVNDLLIIGNQGHLYVEEKDFVIGDEKAPDILSQFVLQLNGFCEAISQGIEPPVNGAYARKVVAAIEAAQLSIATGRSVNL